MADKVYLVQTWGAKGELVDNYETLIAAPAQLKELKTFLKSKHAHVQLTPVTRKRVGK